MGRSPQKEVNWVDIKPGFRYNYNVEVINMEKAYISNLKFGNVNWQIWFMGNDDEETNEKWREAHRGLNAVGDSCTTPDEFYSKALEHFKSFGFIHVPK